MEEILEYLAGLKADGYLLIDEKRRDYQYRIYDKSIEFLLLVAELIERVGYKAHIYARGGGRWYELVVYGKDFTLLIDELWHRLLENPTNAFARDLADAEASVIKGNPNKVKFTNSHRTYAERRRSGMDYVVVITGVDNITRFAESIGFLHRTRGRGC
uniref:rRNA intron-encoded endonuclease n=1 Tax=Pyrobaculum sp. M1T TaxID=278051 RepID=Q6L6Z7_9CREN|nr:rRNA intron-encoded endonuclease [Pyrobaculum sp. M1T]